MFQLTDFLERRLARRFRAHDHDSNGFLQRHDFEMSAVRMAEEFGLGERSIWMNGELNIDLQVYEDPDDLNGGYGGSPGDGGYGGYGGNY